MKQGTRLLPSSLNQASSKANLLLDPSHTKAKPKGEEKFPHPQSVRGACPASGDGSLVRPFSEKLLVFHSVVTCHRAHHVDIHLSYR